MAYNKTETILAEIEGRQQRIIGAALDQMAKDGFDINVSEAAARAGLSVGVVYKYFPDKKELLAKAMNKLLERHRAILENEERFADALIGYIGAMGNPRLMTAMVGQPRYREGIQEALAWRLRNLTDMAPKPRQIAAGAILGLLWGAYVASDGDKASARQATTLIFRMFDLKATV